MDGEFEVVNHRWYSILEDMPTIGIVVIKTPGGHKAYIGTGHGVYDESDIRRVLAHGARFHEAHLLWPQYEGWAE